MEKGRPVKSEIRQNVVEILYFIKNSYGYGIYKVYTAIFPKVTLRSIYYHLRKGVDLGEFVAITVSDPSAVNFPAEIRIYYSDADVAAVNIDESTLRLSFYNETSASWTKIDAPNGGVNTLDNYVWANVSHFSTWGVFGSTVAPEPSPAPSGGGGGGGGGGGAAFTTGTPAKPAQNTTAASNPTPAPSAPEAPAPTATSTETTTGQNTECRRP